MYKVRKARLVDVDRIAGLWNGLIEDQNEYRTSNGTERVMEDLKRDSVDIFKSFARRSIHSKNGLVLVAVNEGEPIGYLIGFIQNNIPVFEMKRIAYISDIYVSEDHRKKGLATRMGKEFESWASRKGLDRSSLQVIFNNERAKRLYSKWGYSDTYVTMRKRIYP